MIVSSNFLPFLGVLVLAFVLDYCLTFRFKLWHKQRNGEILGKATPYRLPGVVGLDRIPPWGSSKNPLP